MEAPEKNFEVESLSENLTCYQNQEFTQFSLSADYQALRRHNQLQRKGEDRRMTSRSLLFGYENRLYSFYVNLQASIKTENMWNL